MARRYGQRPSLLVGLDPSSPLALDFDVAVMGRGLIDEGNARREAERQYQEDPEGGGRQSNVLEADDLPPGFVVRG